MEPISQVGTDSLLRASELPTPCHIEIPEEAQGAKLVVVYDALKEAASLARVIWSIQQWGCRTGDRVKVFHLVSTLQSVLVENGQLLDVLEIGDQRLPAGAVLVQESHEAAG